MKSSQCIICGNETLQGGICALCNAGITQMHEDLIKLLKKDKNWNLVQKLKIIERKKRYSLN